MGLWSAAGTPRAPRERLAALLKLPVRVHLTCTGAGAGVQNEIWSVPGCSSFFAGASFPYAADATTALLGFTPERFCSPEVALDLAMASYVAAFDPTQRSREPIGLGLTASVASLEEHRGDHRIHLACMTSTRVLARNVTLAKGKGDLARARDGEIADAEAVSLLLAAAGVEPADGYDDVTAQARRRFFERPTFDARGCRFPAGAVEAPALAPRSVLFPGAFNPPHEGHFAIARQLDKDCDRRVVFAITTDPPHKPPLTVGELLQRARMLEGHARVFTQGDPLYLDKARAFPRVPFVLGADALVRMLDPKWGVDVEELLAEFGRLGTRFYVIGRLVEGAFMSADEAVARVPEAHRGLFVGATGRWDASSTAERARVVARGGG
jgi:cytidyltransferase-like protein